MFAEGPSCLLPGIKLFERNVCRQSTLHTVFYRCSKNQMFCASFVDANPPRENPYQKTGDFATSWDMSMFSNTNKVIVLMLRTDVQRYCSNLFFQTPATASHPDAKPAASSVRQNPFSIFYLTPWLNCTDVSFIIGGL